MNSKKIIGVVVVVLIIGVVSGLFYFRKQSFTPTPATPLTVENKKTSMMTDSASYSSKLTDVTRGAILGVDTQRNSSGSVMVSDSPGNYSLVATFENLPDPKNTDFYEGWLVSSNPVAVISTGRAIKENGVYVNRFETSENVSFYNMYVLTLEPDDNDPASAYHILEGTFK